MNSDTKVFVQLVYHNNRFVKLLLPHIAEEDCKDGRGYYYSFTLTNGKKLPKRPKSPERRCFDRLYKSIFSRTTEIIDPDQLSDSDLKELCNRNNVPLHWVKKQRLCNLRRERLTRSDSRKRSCLSEDEYERFMKELANISKRSLAIASVMWLLNHCLEDVDDFVTLIEVLWLTLQNMHTENGSTCICFSNSYHFIGKELPEAILTMIREQIRPNSLFIFSNEEGGPLRSSDVIRDFKLAGKLAGIEKPVGSLSFRPVSKRNFLVDYPITETADKGLEDVSEQEWEDICFRLPNLKNKRGRISKHSPRDLLNGILFHLRTGIAIRKLPSKYPSWRAVCAKLGIWRKSGLLAQILKTRS